MTKEQAIHITSQLLMHIYHDDSGDFEKMVINAHILTAEADGDVDYLCNSLDKVIEFCNKLKKAMYNQV